MSKKIKKFYKKIKTGAKPSKAFKDVRKMVLKSVNQNKASDDDRNTDPSVSYNTAEVIENYANAASKQQISFQALAAGFDIAVARMENVVAVVKELDDSVDDERKIRNRGLKMLDERIATIEYEIEAMQSFIGNIAYIFEANLDIDIYGSRKQIKKQLKKIRKNNYIVGVDNPPACVFPPYNKDGEN